MGEHSVERHTLTDDELSLYHNEIDLIRQFDEAAERRFQQYRETKVAVFGSGGMFDAWLIAARRSGLQRIHVAEALDDLVLRTFDVVVHLSDEPVHGFAVLLEQLCRRADLEVLQAVVHGDRIWVGSGWESLVQRLDPADRARPVPPAAATIAANHLASLCFRQLTGIAETTRHPRTTEIDLRTLRRTTHTLLPHPCAAAVLPEPVSEFLTRTRRLATAPRLTADEIAERSAACYSERIGVFRGIDEHHFALFPLRVSQVTVAGVDGLIDTVVASGLDFDVVRGFGETGSHTVLFGPPSLVADRVVATSRLTIGRVVVRRASWIARLGSVPRRHPGEEDVHWMVRTLTWVRRHGIPQRCFVRVGAEEPLYVDFSNWFLLVAVERMLADNDQVITFTEVLPPPGITEFLFHLTG